MRRDLTRKASESDFFAAPLLHLIAEDKQMSAAAAEEKSCAATKQKQQKEVHVPDRKRQTEK